MSVGLYRDASHRIYGGECMTVSSLTAPLDAFSGAVADAYFSHRLDVRGRVRTPAELRSVDLGPVRLARIGWGAEVSVTSDHPGAWAVNVPRSGMLEASVSGKHVVSLNGQATICPPDVSTRMSRWSADCSIVGMRVDRGYLADQVPALVGISAEAMPRQLDLRSPSGRAWLGLLSSIGSAALRNPSLVDDPVVSRRLAGTLTAAFVTACFPDEPTCGTVRPRIVGRVLEAMERDPARDWTAAQLAKEAGVGIRRLQQGFRQYTGTTPTGALQEIRLARVHAELLSGEDSTVGDIALRWGFTHLGRFSGAYRRRYGVTPSQSLRGAPGP